MKMLPCPFCGSTEVDPEGWMANDSRTGPACDNCNGSTDTVERWNRRVFPALTHGTWQPIETAPKDRPILAWCDHEADPYTLDDGGKTLTIYGAHAEGMSHVETGLAIVEWGGGFDDSSYEYPGASLPDWWFQHGTDFEVAANPTHWMPLPEPPK